MRFLVFLSFSWLAVRPGDHLFQSIQVVFIHMVTMAVVTVTIEEAAAVASAHPDKPRKATANCKCLALHKARLHKTGFFLLFSSGLCLHTPESKR
ncbi:hypothetical protein TKWG_16365 [Advenella kashmirensis WT001]|uniref:Uncharacterized protein n=1 Tax=Advenella kashmirensis (strain DSM 17095 / LMG 22695 / WT001) TaxID=1036672 RepID=I3UDY6_ADVKW|nr:hypothetical protein TKWG_16365 [Advenella kashmirensis WT001]